jgi:hypothetical protein
LLLYRNKKTDEIQTILHNAIYLILGENGLDGQRSKRGFIFGIQLSNGTRYICPTWIKRETAEREFCNKILSEEEKKSFG